MITEDYISFETAKLLKEKGFECATLHYYYDKDGDLLFSAWRVDVGKNEFVAPTLQMAMKWLRDTFHLEIYPFHDAIQENNDWWYRIERHSKGCGLTEHESDIIYKTYEESCEAAIKYCLENLV